MGINKEDKDKALEAAMLQIQKQFGKGAIMKLGSDEAKADLDRLEKALAAAAPTTFSPTSPANAAPAEPAEPPKTQ